MQVRTNKAKDELLRTITNTFEVENKDPNDDAVLIDLQQFALVINEQFDFPLSEEEVLDTIERHRKVYSKRKYDAEQAEQAEKKNKKAQKKQIVKKDYKYIAEYMNRTFDIVYLDGTLAIFDGKYWRLGNNPAEWRIIQKFGAIKTNDRNEVLKYMSLMNEHGEIKSVKSMPDYITFENEVRNVRTGEAFEHDKKFYTTNIIPHNYVDKTDKQMRASRFFTFLEDVSCADQSIANSLMEVLGSAMWGGTAEELKKVVILSGEGANGKSTYLNIIKTILGKDNFSSLALNEINERFKRIRLLGKLANIGSDIAGDTIGIRECATIKNVISGEGISAEEKNKPAISFNPYALQIFACNDFPKFTDTSDGFFRRFLAIPFNAKFSKELGNLDMQIGKVLCSEEEIETAICMGFRMFKRAIEKEEISTNTAMDELINDIRTDSNSILKWIETAHITQEFVDGKTPQEVHGIYSEWCSEANFKPYSLRGKFSSTIQRELNVESVKGVRGVRNFEAK